LGYLDFLKLLIHSTLILSDSGSIQQEVITFGKKCVRLLLGDPFPELKGYPGIESVYPVKELILDAAETLLEKEVPRHYENPLGEGDASRKIVKCIKSWC